MMSDVPLASGEVVAGEDAWQAQAAEAARRAVQGQRADAVAGRGVGDAQQRAAVGRVGDRVARAETVDLAARREPAVGAADLKRAVWPGEADRQRRRLVEGAERQGC